MYQPRWFKITLPVSFHPANDELMVCCIVLTDLIYIVSPSVLADLSVYCLSLIVYFMRFVIISVKLNL